MRKNLMPKLLFDLENSELQVKVACTGRAPWDFRLERDTEFAFDEPSYQKAADPAPLFRSPVPSELGIGRVPPFPMKSADECGCGNEIIDVWPVAFASD